MIDESLLGDFISETQDLLQEMESTVLRLKEKKHDKALIDDIFRSIHTIKGSSEYLGMARIAEVAHKLESLLDLIRQNNRSVNERIIQLLMDAGDRIGLLLKEVMDQKPETISVDDLVAEISALIGGDDSVNPLPASAGPVGTAPALVAEQDRPYFDAEIQPMEDIRLLMDLAQEDEELFAIFIEQFKEGYLKLKQAIGRLNETDQRDTIISDCLKAIGSLRSSANYMGCDQLCRLYDTWTERINASASLLLGQVPNGVAEFIRSAIHPASQKLIDLIPGQWIDFSLNIPVTDQEVAEDCGGAEPGAGLANGVDAELFIDLAAEAALPDSGVAKDSEREDEELSLDEEPVLGLDPSGAKAGSDEGSSDQQRPAEMGADTDRTNASDIPSDTNSKPIPVEERLPGLPNAALIMDDFHEEYDGDLFELFRQQLEESIHSIRLELAPFSLGAKGTDFRMTSERCLEHIARLAASANYMGYDKLCDLYQQWRYAIEEFLESYPPESNGAGVEQFISKHMHPMLRKVESVFHISDIRTNAPEPSAADPDGAESLEESKELVADWSDSIGQRPQTASQKGSAGLSESDAVDLQPDEQDLFRKLENAFNFSMPSHNPAAARDFAGELVSELLSGEDDVDGKDAGSDSAGAVALGTPGIIDDYIDTQTFESELIDLFTHESVQTEPQAPGDGYLFEDPLAAMEFASGQPDALFGRDQDRSADGPVAYEETVPAEQGKESTTLEKLVKHSFRVDASKIDNLMNQVGELVVNRSVFTQLTNELKLLQQYFRQQLNLDKKEIKPIKELVFKLGEATVSLGRLANELQEGVMKVRMLPISQLFSRYPRLVHDLMRKSDKLVQLQVKGEDTELDRMVIEEIADPLIHIIRNAVDHGIEKPELRKLSGKAETGTIVMEAYHESNHVVIEIADDGQGLDLVRIREKAVAAGLLTEEGARKMSPRQLSELITVPGFSTAETVSHTSGRGVGMDIVKKNIEKLNGTLEIDSVPGKGTRFRIKIPLTLAIFSALLVKVGDDLYTIPLSSVEETIRIRATDLTMIDGVQVMHLRDQPLPLLSLPVMFKKRSTLMEGDRKLYAVIVNNGQMRVGLIVDELIGQEEVVIKPLEDYLQENSGFSGATILGDGQISLILDAYELAKISMERNATMDLAAALV